jgi:hypothetical protein
VFAGYLDAVENAVIEALFKRCRKHPNLTNCVGEKSAATIDAALEY